MSDSEINYDDLDEDQFRELMRKRNPSKITAEMQEAIDEYESSQDYRTPFRNKWEAFAVSGCDEKIVLVVNKAVKAVIDQFLKIEKIAANHSETWKAQTSFKKGTFRGFNIIPSSSNATSLKKGEKNYIDVELDSKQPVNVEKLEQLLRQMIGYKLKGDPIAERDEQARQQQKNESLQKSYEQSKRDAAFSEMFEKSSISDDYEEEDTKSSGKAASSTQQKKCSFCKGKGVHPDGVTKCMTCKGKGFK